MSIELITSKNEKELHSIRNSLKLQTINKIIKPTLADPVNYEGLFHITHPDERFLFLRNERYQFQGMMNYKAYHPQAYTTDKIISEMLASSPDVERYDLLPKQMKLDKHAPNGKLIHLRLFEAYQRRKGIGTKMLDYIIEEEQPDMIFLEAWSNGQHENQDNPTFSFYKSRGFSFCTSPEEYAEPLMIWERESQ